MEKLVTSDNSKINFYYEYELLNSNNLLNEGTSFDPTGFIKDNKVCGPVIEQDRIIFNDDIKPLDKWDYIAAFSSGTVCSIIDILFTNKFSLANAKKWGNKKIEDFVIEFAKYQGFKGNELRDAIAHLEKLFILESDKAMNQFGGGLNHHLRDFVHHPSILGLVFSILSQFTEKGFGTDNNGNFIIVELDHSLFVNKTFEQKIFDGTITWMFHLISDMAGSSSSLNGGTGIPGFVLSVLKELSVLPIFKKISIEYKDKEITYSQLISKIFNGTYFRDVDNSPIRFDLRAEIGIVKELCDQMIPVIINECLVRSFYSISRFCYEIKKQNIEDISDISKITPANFLPYNSDSLNRMLTVSSGTFTAIDLSQAAIASKINKDNIVKDFLIRINIPGIVRFSIACSVEVKTLIRKKQFNDCANINIIPELKDMTLDRDKSRILYSLEYLKTVADICKENNAVKKRNKLDWLENWKKCTIGNLKEYNDFFITNEKDLRIAIESELNESEKVEWIYIVYLEVSLFRLYFPLSEDTVNKYKHLKPCIANINKVLDKYQDVMDIDVIRSLPKLYEKYVNKVQNKTATNLINTGIATAISAAVCCATIFYAPQIAVLIVGNSFSGLYGAALANASLALIGGGSLALGGLGMFGGTMILAGGSTLLSLATAGTAISTITNYLKNSNLTLDQCAKLMVYSKVVLMDRLNDVNSVQTLANQLHELSLNISKEIEDAKGDKDNPYRNNIKELKKSVKYLDKCSKDLMLMTLN